MEPNTHALFPAHTRFSLVLQAANIENRRLSEEALNRLCADYWEPVYAFARHRGLKSADAQDCVQEVFAKLASPFDPTAVQSGLPTVCVSREMKLRAFLMQQVNDYISKQSQRARRPKHGAGVEHVSLDYSGAEDRLKDDSVAGEPEAAFDYRWARNTLDRCLALLRAEETDKGHGDALPWLLPFLDSSAPGVADYEQAAAALGQSEDATRKQVQRLRQRYKAILEHEVAQTLASETGAKPTDAAVLDEMRCLATAIQRHG